MIEGKDDIYLTYLTEKLTQTEKSMDGLEEEHNDALALYSKYENEWKLNRRQWCLVNLKFKIP